MSDQNYVKIVLTLSDDEDNESNLETIWAIDLGDNKYQIKNFPFYYYGLSYDDVIEAYPIRAGDDRPYIARVIEKSGHKTVRVIFNNDMEKEERVLEHLASMNCGYEALDNSFYYSVNIQPECKFDDVCDYLTQENLRWEYADPDLTYDKEII